MFGNELWPTSAWRPTPWSTGPWLDAASTAAPLAAACAAPRAAEPRSLFDSWSGWDIGSGWSDFLFWSEGLQRRRRDTIDAALYDFGRLDRRARAALADCGTAHPVLVAHPHGRRGLTVYPGAEEWGMSIDAGARVLALVGPGSSALAAAAFARHVADSLGEPVVAAPPGRRLSDLTLDLWTPLEAVWADSMPSVGDEVDAAPLLALARAGRAGLSMIVSHGLGGRLLAELLRLDLEEGRREGCCRATEGAVLAMIGGAPALPTAQAALHLIGGCDWFGWSISDPAHEPWRIAPFAGGHLNPSAPGALPLEGLLGEAAAALGLPDRA